MSFVWMKRRGSGRFKIVRQVTIEPEALDKIADILGIPKEARVEGTMYIATKKPPKPPPRTSGGTATRAATSRRPRQRK